jgi:DNA (cytosine-5)-methyltransferase 1
VCDADAAFLRSVRPPYEALRPRVRLVDLFAGCGGLTLGAAEAARRLGLGIDVRLAVDSDPTAATVYQTNFPGARVTSQPVEELFDGRLGARLTPAEMTVKQAVGEVDLLLGGPPCQGYSDLNNHTRRSDPRNALYAKVARAAQVLEPTLVLIENVPTVRHDARRVLETAVAALNACGYEVAQAVIDSSMAGVPQRRRRHLLLGSRDRRVDVQAVLTQVRERCPHHPRSVRWAIGDLLGVSGDGIFDSPSKASCDNAERLAWLFAHDEYDLPNDLRPRCHHSDHSYKSMYGRLKWDEPAQTITTGFGSMGQGRYVHPSEPRTMTPHEAARLQTLPDFLDFSAVGRRGRLARLIGNAVPPLLASAVLEPALRALGLSARVGFPMWRGDSSGRAGTRRQRRRAAAAPRARRGVPEPSSPEVHTRMAAVRQAGTAAELALRAEVDRLGLLYHANVRVPGTRFRADLLFDEFGVVVMVDGCFWHGCPLHGSTAKANESWWREKIASNRRRDAEADRLLHEMGWVVLRFWEHEDPQSAARGIAAVIARREAALRAVPAPTPTAR